MPHVVEAYELRPVPAGTAFTHSGERGADLSGLGSWWGDRVAAPWKRAVARSLDAVATEAERRAGR